MLFRSEDLNLAIVQQAVVAQYETEVNRGQHPSKGATKTANKISAVKCKHDNPCFSKQGGQQQPRRQCGSRGSGQNRKDKGKGKAVMFGLFVCVWLLISVNSSPR